MMTDAQILAHLGPLHPVEAYLTFVIALAPFALLALVFTVASRRDHRLEREQRRSRNEQ